MVGMASFATKEQMAQRSQGAIPANTPFVDAAIAAATREIRKFCGWHIATEEQTIYRVRPLDRYARNIFLPSLRIASIDELTIAGSPVDPAAVDFDPETGETTISGARVVVKMTHGYSEVPADLAELTLMIASRALGSPLGYTREQSGQRSVSASLTAAGVAGGTVILPHEAASLSAYSLGWQP